MCFKIVDVLVKKNIILENERHIYNYGLFVIYFNLLCLFSILLQGCLFGQIKFTIIFLLFFLPYRLMIGGFHCKTPKQCLIIFNLTFFLCLVLHVFNIFENRYVFMLGIIIYYMYIYHVIHSNIQYKLIIKYITIIISFMLFFIPSTQSGVICSIYLNSILYFVAYLEKVNKLFKIN